MKIALTTRAAVLSGLLAACPAVVRADFLDGHIAVLRLGVGGTIDDSAQALFIDEYDTATGLLVGAHALPGSGAGALTLGGAGEHDGHLSLSANGRYLVLGGYRADAGSADPVPSNATRVIGRVDAGWNVDTTTTLEAGAYDRTHLTGVVSDDGQRFWTVGDGKYVNPSDAINGFLTPTTSGGLRYVDHLGASASINVGHVQAITTDGTGKALQPWPDSIRSARIVNGQLYLTTPAYESFTNRGAYRTADPLPTTGPQTVIPVITNTEGSGADPKGKFVPKSDVILLDLDASVPGLDTAYTTGGKDDYEKWALVDGDWTMLATELLPSGQEINAFDALVQGGDVVLFASTDQGIFRLVDSAGYNAAFSSTFPMDPFIAAGTGMQFRGIALVPEPAALVLIVLTAAMARRRRR